MNPRPALRLAVSLILLPFHNACTEEGSTAEGIPNPTAISLAATQISLTLSVAMESFVIPQLELGFGNPGSTAGLAPVSGVPATLAPGDTLLSALVSCPTTRALGAGNSVAALEYEYARGCNSSLTGLRNEGNLRFEFTSTPTLLQLKESVFTEFRRGDTGMDGILEILGSREGARVRATVRAFALGIFSPGGSALFSGSLFVTWDPNGGDPENPRCQQYSVNEGSGTLQAGNRSYSMIVQAPLQLATCCGFVVSGQVLITAAGFLPATIDYGDGTCDDRAVMISGTESIPLILAGS